MWAEIGVEINNELFEACPEASLVTFGCRFPVLMKAELALAMPG